MIVPSNSNPPANTEPAVVLERVAVSRNGRAVLRDISLRMDAGESVGLIGRNGAGKTTLLLALVGLHRVDSGNAVVCGLDVSDRKDVRRLRQLAGIVMQNADDQLFCGTVFDDVAFGPLNLGLDDEAVRRRVGTALERVGVATHADRISHHLSAGEKRRTAIATALAMEPRILLLDEPTGELDPVNRRNVIELFNALPQTKLIATHDLELVLETCPRAILLDGGRIAADGPARRLLADRELMETGGLEVPYSLR